MKGQAPPRLRAPFLYSAGDHPESFVPAQCSYPFVRPARLTALFALARAWSNGLRQIWPVGAAARSERAAQTRPFGHEQHQRPVQTVDPADRAAETAVLPRFHAEISRTPSECVPSPIATASFTPRTSLCRRSPRPSERHFIATQARRSRAVSRPSGAPSQAKMRSFPMP